MEYLKVFLASSSENMNERENVVAIIDEINDILPHVQLKVFRWETGMESGSVDGENIQSDINPNLDNSELTIVLFYSKLGKFTQLEFDRSEIRRKKLFVYFKEGFSPQTEAEAIDYLSLIRLKNKLDKENRILYSMYHEPLELKLKIHRDILLFIKDEYPFAEKSVFNLLKGLNIDKLESSLLRGLATLSANGKGYSMDDLTSFFVSDDIKRDTLDKLLRTMTEKGLILLFDGKYRINSVFRRHFLSCSADSDFFVDNLVQKINFKILSSLKLNSSQPGLTPDDIRCAEQILIDFRNKNSDAITYLKKNLAELYIKLFVPGSSTRNINRAIMLLEEIKSAYHDTEIALDLKLTLADSYIIMSDVATEPKERKEYLEKAERELLEIVHPNVANAKSRFRYELSRIKIDLKLNGSSETLKNNFLKFYRDEDLKLENSIDNIDKFYELMDISKLLRSNGTSVEIVQKVIDITKEQFGEENERLFRPYLEGAELLILVKNRSKSYSFLAAAKLISNKSSEVESTHRVNALFAKWAIAFQ